MNRMSKKGRIWLAIGCFISSFISMIGVIILLTNEPEPEIVGAISAGTGSLAFFVFAFIFLPPKGYVPIREEKKEQPKPVKYKTYKDRKPKEPFISDDEWDELEEEEEEAEMIDDIFNNDD